MNTWPISSAIQADRLWLGIPDHLADGSCDTDVASLPTLEERCGDSWSQQLLRVLLPQDRAWAWWTRSAIFRRSKLSAANAPGRVFPQRLVQVLRRNVWTRQMNLCVIPSADAQAQQAVLDWAGLDTEQIPDHLWSAAENEREWDLEQISSWCRERACWSDPLATAAQPAERILVLFDRYVFCALEPRVGARVRCDLEELARGWGLRTIEGPPERAWVNGVGAAQAS